MIVTVYQSQWMTFVEHEAIRTDPTRMAQGIMTGIGFLGAGVIFKEGLTVRGLTTAASIWITAAIGILVGIGFWFAAVVGAVAALTGRGIVRGQLTDARRSGVDGNRQLIGQSGTNSSRALLKNVPIGLLGKSQQRAAAPCG
jgi:uncharacterized membrane protein YhiD involved in acid resistance